MGRPPTDAPAPRAEPRPSSLQQGGQRRPLSFSVAESSSVRDLTLYVDRGINLTLGPAGSESAGVLEPLCSAPCSFNLRAGRYRFAVDNHAPLKIRGLTTKLRHDLTVSRGEHVVVRYQSRLWLRILGWVTMLAVPAGGAYLAGLGQVGDGPRESGKIAGGTALTLAGVIGGVWMAVTTDRVTGWVLRE